MGRRWMRSFLARENREAHSMQKQKCVQRHREWKEMWHVPGMQQVLGGKESLEPTREDSNSVLGSPNSTLQVLTSHLRFLPAEKKKMIRVLFPKDYSGGSVEGKIR